MQSLLGTPLPVQLFTRGRWHRSSMRLPPTPQFVDSIAAIGVVEPITAWLCHVPKRPSLEIISGEYRWLGAQLAGLQEIPAYVICVPQEVVRALVIIESIQRGQVLNEEASLRELREEFGMDANEVQKIRWESERPRHAKVL